MALSNEQKEAATLVFGQELADQIFKEGEQRTKDLEEAGVAFKSAEEESEDGEKAGKQKPEDEDEKPEEEKAGLAQFKKALNEIAGMVEDDDATAKAIKDVAGKLTESNMKDHGGTLKMLAGKLKGDLKTRLTTIADAMGKGEGYPAPKSEKGQVEVELDIKALAEALGQQFKADMTPLAEALATVALSQKALEERLGHLEKTQALKQESELPRFTFKMIERASEAKETEVKENDPLVGMKPKETEPKKDGSMAAHFFGN